MHVDLVVRHGQSYGCATLRGRSATSKFVDPGVAGRGTEDVKVRADQHDSGAEGDSAAIAVSGGVDSMTLAVIAHRERAWSRDDVPRGVSRDREPADLTAVNLVERSLRQLLRPEVVRCRLREDGIVVELDETTLDALSDRRRHEVHDLVRAAWADRGDRPVSLAQYRRGSAFLRSRAEV